MNKILIIEDEYHIAHLIELELMREGFEVEICMDGKIGCDKALSAEYDLIILDLMLPNMDGIEVCKKVRESKSTPIIMVTARDGLQEKILGLDSGADDYITKPFAVTELLARVRTAMRRKEQKINKLSIGALTLNQNTREVFYNTTLISLTMREYDLLLYLLKNKGRVVSRDEILSNVWDFEYIGDTNVVDVYVRYLRAKIDDIYNVKIIDTVRGIGYMVK